MNTSYRIDVIGQTWGGLRGSYSKPFKTVPHPLRHEWLAGWIKGEFGDFESITDYRVTRLEYHFERQGHKSVSTHSEEIVRDWNSEENEMAFQEMNQP